MTPAAKGWKGSVLVTWPEGKKGKGKKYQSTTERLGSTRTRQENNWAQTKTERTVSFSSFRRLVLGSAPLRVSPDTVVKTLPSLKKLALSVWIELESPSVCVRFHAM